MKFKIQMKDPDGVYESVDDAAKESVNAIEGVSEQERKDLIESRREEFYQHIKRWFKYGEYLTVEVDTETNTIRVCES